MDCFMLVEWFDQQLYGHLLRWHGDVTSMNGILIWDRECVERRARIKTHHRILQTDMVYEEIIAES